MATDTADTPAGAHSSAALLEHAPATREEVAAHFESVYRSAAGDASRIPWADRCATPALVSWLNAEAAGRVRPGARAVVVGCGLGDDVAELLCRGYDAVGFDVSPTAVEWARRRFPDAASNFLVADLLAPPSRFRHRFDLVIEAHTLQAVDPALREPMAAGVAQLACPRGLILTIARGRDESDLLEHIHSPPYPFTAAELTGLFEPHGWRPVRAPDDFMDGEDPPQRRLRVAFAQG